MDTPLLCETKEVGRCQLDVYNGKLTHHVPSFQMIPQGPPRPTLVRNSLTAVAGSNVPPADPALDIKGSRCLMLVSLLRFRQLKA